MTFRRRSPRFRPVAVLAAGLFVLCGELLPSDCGENIPRWCGFTWSCAVPSTALHGVGAEIDRIIALISLSFVLCSRNEEKVYVYLSRRFPPLWCSKSKLPWLFYMCCFVYSVDNEVLFY